MCVYYLAHVKPPEEKAQAMEALMFLQEKKDGTMKGRMVYNGKPTREWLSREDSASPTAALESMFLTSIIDAKEERDVMSVNVPKALIQTSMPDDNKKVIMKITGVLVHLMVEQAPEVYGPHVMYENGKKVKSKPALHATACHPVSYWSMFLERFLMKYIWSVFMVRTSSLSSSHSRMPLITAREMLE